MLFLVMVFIIVVESKLGHAATKPTKNAVDSMLTTESTVTEQDKGPCTKKPKKYVFLYRFLVKNSMSQDFMARLYFHFY